MTESFDDLADVRAELDALREKRRVFADKDWFVLQRKREALARMDKEIARLEALLA